MGGGARTWRMVGNGPVRLPSKRTNYLLLEGGGFLGCHRMNLPGYREISTLPNHRSASGILDASQCCHRTCWSSVMSVKEIHWLERITTRLDDNNIYFRS